jgi:hypothetical protein
MRMTSRHPERSGEWSDWGCRDMDEKAEGCASGRRAHQIPVRTYWFRDGFFGFAPLRSE